MLSYCLIFLAVWLKLLWMPDPADPLWWRGCAEIRLIATTKHWHWQGWKHARVQHCWASCNSALTWHSLYHSREKPLKRKRIKTRACKFVHCGIEQCWAAQVVRQLKVQWELISRPLKSNQDLEWKIKSNLTSLKDFQWVRKSNSVLKP